MKTLEQLDKEIAATEAEANRLYKIHQQADKVYHETLTAWCAVYNPLEELKRRRAILADLLEEKKVEATA